MFLTLQLCYYLLNFNILKPLKTWFQIPFVFPVTLKMTKCATVTAKVWGGVI